MTVRVRQGSRKDIEAILQKQISQLNNPSRRKKKTNNELFAESVIKDVVLVAYIGKTKQGTHKFLISLISKTATENAAENEKAYLSFTATYKKIGKKRYMRPEAAWLSPLEVLAMTDELNAKDYWIAQE